MSKKLKSNFIEFPSGDMIRRDHVLRVYPQDPASPGTIFAIIVTLGGELSMVSGARYTFDTRDARDAALGKIRKSLKLG